MPSSEQAALFPAIEPYQDGMLEVGDGNLIHWESCGNPEGKPALVLHGGPGSGCTPSLRRYFDPTAYRIILFDQRGCGRSRPHASDPEVSLATNTTQQLIRDIERLREHVRVEQWLVFGMSWGSTLGLAYAEAFPNRVTSLVLASVVTTTRREVDWITREVGRYFPEQWQRFVQGVPPADRQGDLVAAYYRLLESREPAVREKAARDWCQWEDSHVAVRPEHQPNPRYQDPVFRMAFARLVTHYFGHAAWLGETELLDGAIRLARIPAVLIHGRLDLSSPVDIPWMLAKNWPASELILIDEAGHGTRDPGMAEAVLAATDRFAQRST